MVKFFKYTILILILLVMVFPLLWMFRISFMPADQGLSLSDFMSMAFTFDIYRDIFRGGGMVRYFLNSALVGLAVTAGNILFCFMTGYGLSRYKIIGQRFWFYSIIFVLMIPVHIIIIPLYLLVFKLGLYDTYAALILPFLVSPIGVFMVKQYIDSLPPSVEEAARMDGAGEFRILFKIVMPLCKPVLAVLAIQVFLVNWNSFLYPFILTSSDSLRTLPVGLALYQGHQAIDWPHLMAGSSLAVVPVLVIFWLFQKQIVSGITAGAIKQ